MGTVCRVEVTGSDDQSACTELHQVVRLGAAEGGCFMPRTRPALIEAFVVQCECVGREHWVRPSGELDVATAPTLERALQAIELTAAQRIILDLRGLSFMDSTGVHLLLRASQRALVDGHELGLIAGSVAVQRPLALSATLQRLPFIAAPVATVARAVRYAA